MPVDNCWHLLVSLGVCGCLWVSVGVCWCLLVSDGFVLSIYVLKMPGEVIRGYLRAFFGFLWSLDASVGPAECSALVIKEMVLC